MWVRYSWYKSSDIHLSRGLLSTIHPFWRRVCMTDFMGINCACIESTVPSVIPWSGGKFNDCRDALEKYRAHRSKSLCAPTSVDISERIKRTYTYIFASRKNPWKCDRLNGRAKYFWEKVDLLSWKKGEQKWNRYKK